MNLRQQIVNDRVEEAAQLLQLPDDQAFVRVAHSLITGQSLHTFDPGDLVEGSQDKQIDTITIEEGSDQATVYVLQMKNTKSFSSNNLIKLRNGLNWLFHKSRTDIKKLSNQAFQDKIFEYRSLQSSFGPSNIRVIVVFATNGLTSDLSDEFRQELQTTREQYDTGTFAGFSMDAYGADELVDLINAQERQHKRIDAEIRIKYDANNPSLIRYFSEDLTGLVCTVPGSEIARLVNDDPEGAIFDLNVRRYLGTGGAVNKDIQATCTDSKGSYQFWFLNNGITMVCDDFDAVTDPDSPKIKLSNVQIVNGCQTATTLALAQRENSLAKDIRVLVRVYKAVDSDLVSKIVQTTNNQNRITGRDLRANDPVQIDMERGFKIYNYFYERKTRQFAQQQVDASRIVPNELVAQSYLAIALKTPSDARRRKYKVWGELYNKIFMGKAVEPYLLTVLIARQTSQWVAADGLTTIDDDVKRKIAKNGTFHLARMAAFLWRKGDKWDVGAAVLKKQLKELEGSTSVLGIHLKEAFSLLEETIRGEEHYVADLDAALKSYTLDEAINRSLYTKQKT